MPSDALLGLLDPSTKRAIFANSLNNLHSSPQLNLDALRICLQLASDPTQSSWFDLQGLWDKIIAWIVVAQDVPDDKTTSCLYEVADICLSCDYEVARILHEKIYTELESILSYLQRSPLSTSQEPKGRLSSATAYLRFLRCSFWLPPDRHHLICERTIPLMLGVVGYDDQEDIALDALSALLSLLRGNEIIMLAGSHDTLPLATHKLALCLHTSFWDGIQNLNRQYRETHSSKILKVWFQWISLIHVTGSLPLCLQEEAYWQTLSERLIFGFAEEQKYSLGIINQSLLIAQEPIFTKVMEYHGDPSERKAYEHYTTLFRTIVLNRYTNQVAACLPELTTLLGPGSRITSTMAASLLSAALHTRVQEGIRKLIGYWYIDHTLKNPRGAELDGRFLTLSFLPWATEGSLYTSSIKSTRSETVCLHGDTIAKVLARLVSAQYSTDSSGERQHPRGNDSVILQTVRFIQKADGKIFQPAILYLLEGLVRGLETCTTNSTAIQKNDWFNDHELDEIMKVSRLTGLPEISSDLLRVYCQHICTLIRDDFVSTNLCEVADLKKLAFQLDIPVKQEELHPGDNAFDSFEPHTLESFVEEVKKSKHSSIQGNGFALSCKKFAFILNRTRVVSIPQEQLLEILHAFWEEAERCEFSRQVVMHLPPVLFHPSCIEVCIEQRRLSGEKSEDSLEALLSAALLHLQQLSKGRSYILSVLATSVRKALFSHPSIASILPLEEFIIEYSNNPPVSKPEFLFEMAAAEKLGYLVKHISYASYYGNREWHAYAALIDILRRWPEEQMAVAKSILLKLVKSWRDQKIPVPIKSPWKTTLQLQVMLIFSDFCIAESEADYYLESLTHALSNESWPRYRYLLEWIIARIYSKYQNKTLRILDDLDQADQLSPAYIASLIKLALLVAPFQSESFAFKLFLHLVCFSTSPKVQIRHEANFALPLLFDLAEVKKWSSITHDAAFVALNKFIRQLAKYHAEPWTIRTLRLDALRDFCLVNIFQGRYLTIESPEKEWAAYEDFVALEARNHEEGLSCPPPRVLLGEEPLTIHGAAALPTRQKSETPDRVPVTVAIPNPVPAATSVFLQTKAGYDFESLHPPADSPFTRNQRPATVILVASLIDNPTNLGGLSRISESFGLEALYIDDLKKMAHKDFKATSVTSEKHFPIRALKIADIPQFLVDAKRRGYEVVGVEQTDRSGILGENSAQEMDGTVNRDHNRKDLGTLPKQCVLVLGSEKGGITPEVLTVIDRCVEIKTVGVTRSLNVQTAGGIAVFEWWREWGGKN